jgi:hypothetical protein
MDRASKSNTEGVDTDRATVRKYLEEIRSARGDYMDYGVSNLDPKLTGMIRPEDRQQNNKAVVNSFAIFLDRDFMPGWAGDEVVQDVQPTPSWASNEDI